jgi:WD40 repeat protein
VSGYHEVLLYSGDGTKLIARLIGLSERIQSCVFSPDGKRLAVVGGLPARRGEVQIWDVAEHELLLSVPLLHDTIFGASWSPDGKFVAFGCPDNSVRAINSESGEQVLLQRAPNDWTLATVFSVDGSHVISVGRDMAVKLTDFKTQRFIDNVTSIAPGALRGGILTIDRHPKRDEVVIGGDDGVPRTYSVFRQVARVVGDDSNLIRRFPALPGRIFSVTFSPDSDCIACGTSNNGRGEVVVFSAKYDSSMPKQIAEIESIQSNNRTPEQLALLEKHYTSDVARIADMKGQQGPVYSVAFRPDGALLASAGFDGCIRFNAPDTGELLNTINPFPIESNRPQEAAASQISK